MDNVGSSNQFFQMAPAIRVEPMEMSSRKPVDDIGGERCGSDFVPFAQNRKAAGESPCIGNGLAKAGQGSRQAAVFLVYVMRDIQADWRLGTIQRIPCPPFRPVKPEGQPSAAPAAGRRRGPSVLAMRPG
jgi:hypothetical protein